MKQIDLEYYHVVKARLTDTIEKHGGHQSAENAGSLLLSINQNLEKGIEKQISDAADVLRRLNLILEAEFKDPDGGLTVEQE